MGRRGRKPYKFQDIHHSADGLTSTGLGVLSVLLIVGGLILTIQKRGQAGGIVGLMGAAALLFSAVGLVFAVVSWKDEETMDTFKRVGTLLNIGLLLVNAALLLLGVFAG